MVIVLGVALVCPHFLLSVPLEHRSKMVWMRNPCARWQRHELQHYPRSTCGASILPQVYLWNTMSPRPGAILLVSLPWRASALILRPALEHISSWSWHISNQQTKSFQPVAKPSPSCSVSNSKKCCSCSIHEDLCRFIIYCVSHIIYM